MKTTRLTIFLAVMLLFTGCLPRSISSLIPEGVDKKQYVINSIKARKKLNELVNGNAEGDTRRIDIIRANALRTNLSNSNEFDTRGVFFHFPTLIQALMTAKGVNQAEDLLLDSRNFDLKTSGFYAVFGRYPTSSVENHPGRLTCFVSFAFKDSHGNYYDITAPGTQQSGRMSLEPAAAGDSIMFNFGALCPDNCPTSLGGQ